MKWINSETLGIRGKAFPNALNYRRLEENDLKIMDKVSPAYDFIDIKTGIIWLGTNSSGLHIDFKTNSKSIWLKWKVALNNVPISMTLLAQSGLDLYIKEGNWKFFSSGIPDYDRLVFDEKKREFNCQCVFPVESENFTKEYNEYSVNLSLYDEVEKLEIGIDDDAEIEGLDLYSGKPIIIYGSSITQGCSASRPGMAYTNILRRKLNGEVCNLGFSGYGRLEQEMSHILNKTDPKILVMDCVPNMVAHCREEFEERYEYFYNLFRKNHSETPILFMALPVFVNTLNKNKIYVEYSEKLNNLFNKWREKDQNIYWLDFPEHLFESGDYSVDGIHGNDLGFSIIADILCEKIKEII